MSSSGVEMEGLLIPNIDPRWSEVEWLDADNRPKWFTDPLLPVTPNSIDRKPIFLTPPNMIPQNHNQSAHHLLPFLDDFYLPSQNFSNTHHQQFDYQFPPSLPSSIDYCYNYPLPLGTTFPLPPPLLDYPLPLNQYNPFSSSNDTVSTPGSFLSSTGTVTSTTQITAHDNTGSSSSWLERTDDQHQTTKFEMSSGCSDAISLVKAEKYPLSDDVTGYSDEELGQISQTNYSEDPEDDYAGIEVGVGEYDQRVGALPEGGRLMRSSSYPPAGGNCARKRVAEELGFAELQNYFDMPIADAARRLNVGLTVLKKRCRQLSIRRWPHRKIKSLKALMNNVKELGLVTELQMLEENARMVKEMPGLDLPVRTKKLRQHCFKANYKKRKTIGHSSLEIPVKQDAKFD